MARKQPASVAPSDPTQETLAPGETPVEKPAKAKKVYVNKKKLETPFQKVTRRLARAQRFYDAALKASEGFDDPQSVEQKELAKAKQHLDSCASRYAAVASPPVETEQVEQPA